MSPSLKRLCSKRFRVLKRMSLNIKRVCTQSLCVSRRTSPSCKRSGKHKLRVSRRCLRVSREFHVYSFPRYCQWYADASGSRGERLRISRAVYVLIILQLMHCSETRGVHLWGPRLKRPCNKSLWFSRMMSPSLKRFWKQSYWISKQISLNLNRSCNKRLWVSRRMSPSLKRTCKYVLVLILTNDII